MTAAEIRAWTTANLRARQEYRADCEVAAGRCSRGCGRKVSEPARVCWSCKRARKHGDGSLGRSRGAGGLGEQGEAVGRSTGRISELEGEE